MLIKHDFKKTLKWISTELDKTEVTMYFFGLFHDKVLMYITGVFCAWDVQNVFYKLNTLYLSDMFQSFQ
jgi:hypothetical protein